MHIQAHRTAIKKEWDDAKKTPGAQFFFTAEGLMADGFEEDEFTIKLRVQDSLALHYAEAVRNYSCSLMRQFRCSWVVPRMVYEKLFVRVPKRTL